MDYDTDVHFCCICQEEFPSPRTNLNLYRPDSCFGHWFHRDCLTQWLNVDQTCPVCRIECNFAVDKDGQQIGEEQNWKVATFFKYLLIAIRKLVVFIVEIYVFCSSILESALLRILPCAVCKSFSVEGGPILKLKPCGHQIHACCLIPPVVSFENLACPLPHCRRGFDSLHTSTSMFTRCDVVYNALFPNPQNIVTWRLNYIFFCTCMYTMAFFDSIRIHEMQRQEPQEEEEMVRIVGSCSTCRVQVYEVDAVRPNTCNHLFHRECLWKKTRNQKKCPVRRCRKKFRNMEAVL